MALSFRDSAALEVAIRSGLVSREAAAGGAKVARGADDAIVVDPDKHLPGAATAKLKAAGVGVDATMPARGKPVRCWAEALAPVRVKPAELPALVLFETPTAAGVIELAAELVRLGCDRQELLVSGDRGVIRVVDPPTYTVVRALDREDGLRVYAPDPAKQDLIWTELGFHHPLAEHLKAEPKTLLLCANDGWRTLPDIGWLAVDAALELAVPGRAAPHAAGALPARRRVELRLSQGRRDVPSMWVLRHDAIAKIDQLLAYLPEELAERLMFAATAAEPPTIVVRARTGRQAAPDLALGAQVEEYAPLAGMPDVFAPVGAIVEPPLRRERLRTILGVEPRDVLWLARDGASAFRVERISDAAFAPLADWADYVLHANAAAFEPWLRATEVDFAPFVSSGLEWASGPGEAARPERSDKKKKSKQVVTATVEAPPPSVARTTPTKPPPTPKPAAPVTPQTQVEIDAELAAREAEFIALDAPGDAPERIALLDRLGRIYARLGRLRDAGLCFVRAVWEAVPEAAESRLDGWIAAHVGTAQVAKAFDKAIANKLPSGDEVRLVAMLAARGAPPVVADPHRVTRWLDDHDGELDARALWLARLGLAQLAGGDPLLLAHARDRILARLAGGLPVERELPAFLRLAGRSGALGNTSGDHLAIALDELIVRFEKTRRKRTPLEAPPHLTNAYVSFQMAYGYARIGRADRGRELVSAARGSLGLAISDPVHAYLAAAFSARVDQAIAGQPSETPLPDELVAQLAALDRNQRYKTDRLREVSRILAPLDRPHAINMFTAWNELKGTRGPEFTALRGEPDPTKRTAMVGKLVERAASDDAERERLLDGVLDVLFELPESGAVPLLGQLVTTVGKLADKHRAPRYARALVVAGHFGRVEQVPGLLELLRAALRLVDAAELENVLQFSLRALRRIGLRRETADLLVAAEEARSGSPVQVLRGRLAIAGGLSYLGEYDRAKPIFEQAHATIDNTTLSPTSTNAKERLELVRATALAYAQAPLQHAIAGIAQLSNVFKDISDVQSVNSHYCLSVLDFVESLVLGITSDDLALGEAGRRFVEDDEHLIRRRLHADLGGPA
ncbi:MAG TPA: hypothetical protein VH143_35130 [Kofleriaceae bacterium]|nr:hypothetical protein [Kofleriaceae bacterium]